MNALRILPKAVWIFITSIFIINLSSFLVLPFWGIYLVKNLNFSIVATGVILSVNFLAQRIFALFGGVLGDLFSTKNILVLGLALRGCAYLGLAFSNHYATIMSYSLIMGLGSAFYSPSSKVALLFFAQEAHRSLAFSLRNIAMNLGVAIGPLIGLLLMKQSLQLIFIIAALVHIILCFLNLNFIPKISFLKDKTSFMPKLIDLLRPLQSVKLLSLSFMMFLFMSAYIQIDLTIPLYIKQIFNNLGVSYFFLINSILSCLFSFLLPIFLLNKKNHYIKIYLGLYLIGISFVNVSLWNSPISFIFSAIIFTLAEVIFFPSMDVILSQSVPVYCRGAVFGFSDFFAAIGGVFGNLLGAHLYSYLNRHHYPNRYWAIFGIFILIYCIFFAIYKFILKKSSLQYSTKTL